MRFSDSVLAIDVEAVARLQGDDALSGLWNVFTKCKHSLHDGPRLENITWRLWHKELAYQALPRIASATDLDGQCLSSDLEHDIIPATPSSMTMISDSLSESDHATLATPSPLSPDPSSSYLAPTPSIAFPAVSPVLRSSSQPSANLTSSSTVPYTSLGGGHDGHLIFDSHHRTSSAPNGLSADAAAASTVPSTAATTALSIAPSMRHQSFSGHTPAPARSTHDATSRPRGRRANSHVGRIISEMLLPEKFNPNRTFETSTPNSNGRAVMVLGAPLPLYRNLDLAHRPASAPSNGSDMRSTAGIFIPAGHAQQQVGTDRGPLLRLDSTTSTQASSERHPSASSVSGMYLLPSSISSAASSASTSSLMSSLSSAPPSTPPSGSEDLLSEQAAGGMRNTNAHVLDRHMNGGFVIPPSGAPSHGLPHTHTHARANATQAHQGPEARAGDPDAGSGSATPRAPVSPTGSRTRSPATSISIGAGGNGAGFGIGGSNATWSTTTTPRPSVPNAWESPLATFVASSSDSASASTSTGPVVPEVVAGSSSHSHSPSHSQSQSSHSHSQSSHLHPQQSHSHSHSHSNGNNNNTHLYPAINNMTSTPAPTHALRSAPSSRPSSRPSSPPRSSTNSTANPNAALTVRVINPTPRPTPPSSRPLSPSDGNASSSSSGLSSSSSGEKPFQYLTLPNPNRNRSRQNSTASRTAAPTINGSEGGNSGGGVVPGGLVRTATSSQLHRPRGASIGGVVMAPRRRVLPTLVPFALPLNDSSSNTASMSSAAAPETPSAPEGEGEIPIPAAYTLSTSPTIPGPSLARDVVSSPPTPSGRGVGAGDRRRFMGYRQERPVPTLLATPFGVPVVDEREWEANESGNGGARSRAGTMANGVGGRNRAGSRALRAASDPPARSAELQALAPITGPAANVIPAPPTTTSSASTSTTATPATARPVPTPSHSRRTSVSQPYPPSNDGQQPPAQDSELVARAARKIFFIQRSPPGGYGGPNGGSGTGANRGLAGSIGMDGDGSSASSGTGTLSASLMGGVSSIGGVSPTPPPPPAHIPAEHGQGANGIITNGINAMAPPTPGNARSRTVAPVAMTGLPPSRTQTPAPAQIPAVVPLRGPSAELRSSTRASGDLPNAAERNAPSSALPPAHQHQQAVTSAPIVDGASTSSPAHEANRAHPTHSSATPRQKKSAASGTSTVADISAPSPAVPVASSSGAGAVSRSAPRERVGPSVSFGAVEVVPPPKAIVEEPPASASEAVAPEDEEITEEEDEEEEDTQPARMRSSASMAHLPQKRSTALTKSHSHTTLHRKGQRGHALTSLARIVNQKEKSGSGSEKRKKPTRQTSTGSSSSQLAKLAAAEGNAAGVNGSSSSKRKASGSSQPLARQDSAASVATSVSNGTQSKSPAGSGSVPHRSFVASPLSTVVVPLPPVVEPVQAPQHPAETSAAAAARNPNPTAALESSRSPPKAHAAVKSKRPGMPGRSHTSAAILRSTHQEAAHHHGAVASAAMKAQQSKSPSKRSLKAGVTVAAAAAAAAASGPAPAKKKPVLDMHSSDFETTDEDSEAWSSDDEEDEPPQPRAAGKQQQRQAHLQQPYGGGGRANGKGKGRAADHKEADLAQAAAEAARQREMFRKVPSRSYSSLGLQRQSGLLTPLLKPDPRLVPYLPPNIPGMLSNPPLAENGAQLGRTHNSTHNLGRRPAPLGPLAALKPMTSRAPAPTTTATTVLSASPSTASILKPSKSAAEVRIAPVSVTSQVAVNPSGRPGYRLKGRPDGADVESESEEENPANVDGMSKSLAQRKLEQLAGLRGSSRRSPSQAQQQQQQPQPQQQPPPSTHSRRSDPSDEQVSRQPYPSPQASYITQQVQQHDEFRSELMRTPSLPLDLPHPYNLPAPSMPQSPRTTRRQMMQNEMSESLRRNLLWERHLSRKMLGGGITRITPIEPVQQQNGQGASGSGAQQQQQTSGRQRSSGALSRTKSWAADDYHATGW